MGRKSSKTCENHNSVKKGRPIIKISDYIQFHMLYKLV